jgi:OPA family sugar phosphate sensor protein UhpC-like MFS transporter
LKDPAIWVLGLASACVYVSRYGINNWFVFYLQEAKACGIEKAGAATSFAPIVGALGTFAAGPVSDFVFKGRRMPVSLMYGVLLIVGLISIPLIPPGHIWADCATMSVCGFAIGGLLVFLGGLIAVDLSSKRAAGAAMGFIGAFSYLGAAVGDWIGGGLIESSKIIVSGKATYNFHALLLFWIGSAVVSFLLTAGLWAARRSKAH